MDGLSAAANVIAVIDMGAKVASLCFQYAMAVKGAKDEIQNLSQAVDNTKTALEQLLQLLNRNDKHRLPVTHKLSLEECSKLLTQLCAQLEPGKRRKAMHRIGLRDLKWPFTSKQVEKMVVSLERHQQTFSLGLQIDQTGLILDVGEKADQILAKIDTDIVKLPVATGASFHSHKNEHDATCLHDTRVDLLSQIDEWVVKYGDKKPIFWLNGMAGTGKSTIARTVAKSFHEQRKLGASFFFRRGEGERGNATRFFTTIATELMAYMPEIRVGVKKAVEADPAIHEKALKDQFEKLLLEPLSEAQSLKPSVLVIVIDALDECERDEDIRAILQLLPQTKSLISIRVFVTSRPELPIRLGFKRMPDGTYQDLVLHEVAKPTIEHDIRIYLEHELAKIRDDRNLTTDWPGDMSIHKLVDMAVPLFIFAATVCRFIGEASGNPRRRLQDVLAYESEGVSKLDMAYLPILNSLFIVQDAKEKAKLAKEFQEIVGSIVLLESPLSINSLANLLRITGDDISCRLDTLHSVLSIPNSNDVPIRLLHLSFREFLIDDDKKGRPFFVDEKETHRNLAFKCLELMSGPNGLRQNMCDLTPDTKKSELDKIKIAKVAPPEIQYACRYWIEHLVKSEYQITNQDSVLAFLKGHFLHWLECMSLIGETFKCIYLLRRLQTLTELSNATATSDFVRIARRFTLRFQDILDAAPLQLYYSGLTFAPQVCATEFGLTGGLPDSIELLSKRDDNWDACLSVLEGHNDYVRAISFSPDSTLLVSASDDKSVQIWDTTSGICRSNLQGHTDWVRAVNFAPNGQLIGSGSNDRTVRLWDPNTGSCVSVLVGHTDQINTVKFSPDSRTILSASIDCTARVWNVEKGTCQFILQGHSKEISTAIFSPTGQVIATASHDFTIKLWNAANGVCRSTLEGHTGIVNDVAFSVDGSLIASASEDEQVRLWDTAKGACLSKISKHTRRVAAVSFSPDGQLLASCSGDANIQLYKVPRGTPYRSLKGHSQTVVTISFAPDSKIIASGSIDNSVRLWDIATGSCCRIFKGHSFNVSDVAFSPDGILVASGSYDRTARLWDPAAYTPVEESYGLHAGHSEMITGIADGPDGQLIASSSEDSNVRLWYVPDGTCRCVFKGHAGKVNAVLFSSDGKIVASGGSDRTVRLWEVSTGMCLGVLTGHQNYVRALAFSSDNTFLASASDEGTVIIWELATKKPYGTFNGGTDYIRVLAFSQDKRFVASGCDDGTVKLWDVTIGREHLEFERHSNWVTSITFSPSNKLVVSGCRDATMRVSDLATGQVLRKFDTDHLGKINALCFSRDSQLLVSASRDRYIIVWDIETGESRESLETGCDDVTRIRLSQDELCVHTDKGDFPLYSDDGENSSQSKEYSKVFITDQWISWDLKDFSWLPSEYRPVFSAVCKDVVCLGGASGRMTFLRIRSK